MEQLELFQVASPCIGICQTDARGYCIGCMRSREERFNWLSFSSSQKTEVIRLTMQRARRRQLAHLKAEKLQLLYEQAKNAQPLFDDETQSMFTSIIDNPDLIDSIQPEKLDLLWWFLNTILFPFLLSCLATSFMENREAISNYFSEAKDSEAIKDLASKANIDIETGSWAVVTTNKLNFREGPVLTAKVLHQLKLGEIVEIIDDMGSSWLYVRIMRDNELKTGWIHRHYVVLIKSNRKEID